MAPPAGQDAPSSRPAPKRALLRYQRAIETREAIVRAASSLWGRQGYEATTVEDICASAGVSRSSYYYHFPDKASLLAELDLVTARRVSNEMRAHRAGPDASLDGEVEVLVSGLARRAQRAARDVVAEAMTGSMRALHLVGRLDDREADFGRTLAEAFTLAHERGELPPGSDAVEEAAVLAAMLMEGVLRWAHRTSAHDDLEAALRWRAEVFLAGLRARPETGG
jgi:AcrR family transcriptional regulator